MAGDEPRPGPQEAQTFGALLRRHRLAAGLTQEQLAERAGLGARSVQDLERGVARPLRRTARAGGPPPAPPPRGVGRVRARRPPAPPPVAFDTACRELSRYRR